MNILLISYLVSFFMINNINVVSADPSNLYRQVLYTKPLVQVPCENNSIKKYCIHYNSSLSNRNDFQDPQKIRVRFFHNLQHLVLCLQNRNIIRESSYKLATNITNYNNKLFELEILLYQLESCIYTLTSAIRPQSEQQEAIHQKLSQCNKLKTSVCLQIRKIANDMEELKNRQTANQIHYRLTENAIKRHANNIVHSYTLYKILSGS